MLEQFPREVKLVFKQFPLQMHPFARKAALTSVAAHRQGKFWPVHDAIFAGYTKLSDDMLTTVAREAGLDMQKYEADLKDPKTAAAIDADMRDAQLAEVRGTPAVFVNGRLLSNRSPEGFREAVEAALAKTKGPKDQKQ